MNGSDSDYDAGEFERECRAGKNRLGELDVKDITTREVMKNGQKLMGDDIRVLAIIVEEEQSLDPQLGLYIDGVSKSAIRDLMDYEVGSDSHRLDKLKEANLIEVHEADSLPVSRTGLDPKYAVATDVGRRMVEDMGLVPIVTRDRDLEEQFDMLVADYRDLREAFIATVGRQALMMRMANTSDEDFPEFQFNVTTDPVEVGEKALGDDLSSELSLGEDEYSFGKLIGEMDEAERELAMRELLNENTDEDVDETTD